MTVKLLSHSFRAAAFSLISEMYANCASLHQRLIFIQISKAKEILKNVANSWEELKSLLYFLGGLKHKVFFFLVHSQSIVYCPILFIIFANIQHVMYRFYLYG